MASMTHGEHIAFWIWAVPAILIAIGGQFVISYQEYKDEKVDENDRGYCFVFGAIWPLVAAIAVMIVTIDYVFKLLFRTGPIWLFKKIDDWSKGRTQRQASRVTPKNPGPIAPPAPSTEEPPYRSQPKACPQCGQLLADK